MSGERDASAERDATARPTKRSDPRSSKPSAGSSNGRSSPSSPSSSTATAYPVDIVEQMKALGLFGVTIPEAYGGLGLDLLTYIGVIEELSYGWMSLTGIVNTHTMAATLVMTHGTEEQKQRFLPSLASGERRGCPLAVRARRGERHAEHLVPGSARR